MSNLRISWIQNNIVWENPSANLSYYSNTIKELSGKTDLVIIPEMFSTGFTMKAPTFADVPGGVTSRWMIAEAMQHKTAITGSFIVKENNHYFNRLLFVTPDGKTKTYDKRHLFRMGNENKHYSQGMNQLIVEYREWKIMPLICYDLRFPVWSANLNIKYDLLIYVANWPWKRREVWKTLLKARAIENQAYVAGVNRIGKDGMNITYSGDSSLYDFKGKRISGTNYFKPDISTYPISLSKLWEFRKKFPAWKDGDKFIIDIDS